MTSEEIKQAMKDGSPVTYCGTEYKCITAYIYRRVTDRHNGKATFILQCELLDRCGHSVVIVDAKNVKKVSDEE